MSSVTDFTELFILSADPDIEFRKPYKVTDDIYIMCICKVLNVSLYNRSSQNVLFEVDGKTE